MLRNRAERPVVKDKLPIVVIAAAVVLVVAIAVRLRVHLPPAPPAPSPPQHAAEEAGSKGDYSTRVEERLRMLRAEHARRQHAEESAAVEASGTPQRGEGRQAGRQPPPPGEGEQPKQRDGAALNFPVPNAGVGRTVSELEHTITTHPSREKRIEAAQDLGASEEPDGLRVLLAALGDRDPQVRAAVVESLADYIDEITPDELQAVLKDSDPNVRFEALTLLGLMVGPDALAAANTLLDDPDPDVRDLAEEVHNVLESEPTPLPEVSPPPRRGYRQRR